MSWPNNSLWLWVGMGMFICQVVAVAAIVAQEKEDGSWGGRDGLDGGSVAMGLLCCAMFDALWPVSLSLAATVLILWGAWAGMVRALRFGIRRHAARKKEKTSPPKAEKVTPNEQRIDPTGPDDPFCTCPSCRLLGNHGVEVLQWEPRWLPGVNGERVESSSMSDPPIGSWNAHRTCWSCGFTWHTLASEEVSR